MDSAEAAAERLEEVFRAIQETRMADVPILNPRLRVEAIGFRPWQGGWLGVLVTPWFINLMVVGVAKDGPAKPSGTDVNHVFPAGGMAFMTGEEEGLGAYQMCSLFSPVLEFADQETAVETAKAALAALFDGEAAEPPTQDEAYLDALARGTLTPAMADELRTRANDENGPRARRKNATNRRDLLRADLGETEVRQA